MWEIYAYQNADSLFGIFNAAATIHGSGDYMAAVAAASGRIVWHELALRARVDEPSTPCDGESPPGGVQLWDDQSGRERLARGGWRMARPDLFSVRNTSVEAYLEPMVHEVKATRADLLSDLRQAAKREAYRWLCGECCYVFPSGVAEPEEIPEPFGVWVLHGDLDVGRFEMLRPARHAPCTLPFAVWLALAKSTPLRGEAEDVQPMLDEAPRGQP